MNWNDYVIRRRINVVDWIKSHGADSRDKFLELMKRLNIVSPPAEQLDRMFEVSIPMSSETEIKDESDAIASEGGDQIATWSVADEGGQPCARPNGKQHSKVRPGRDR